MGDFNERDEQWDVTTSPQRRKLHDWATSANYGTVRPSYTTSNKRRGNQQAENLTAASAVDLVFERFAAHADPVVGEYDYTLSDNERFQQQPRCLGCLKPIVSRGIS